MNALYPSCPLARICFQNIICSLPESYGKQSVWLSFRTCLGKSFPSCIERVFFRETAPLSECLTSLPWSSGAYCAKARLTRKIPVFNSTFGEGVLTTVASRWTQPALLPRDSQTFRESRKNAFWHLCETYLQDSPLYVQLGKMTLPLDFSIHDTVIFPLWSSFS